MCGMIYTKGSGLMFFKKKPKYPINAKYQLSDFVNFRFRNELCFGYIFDAYEVNGKILYTIQLGGQCPGFIDDYKEEDIIGLKKI